MDYAGTRLDQSETFHHNSLILAAFVFGQLGILIPLLRHQEPS